MPRRIFEQLLRRSNGREHGKKVAKKSEDPKVMKTLGVRGTPAQIRGLKRIAQERERTTQALIGDCIESLLQGDLPGQFNLQQPCPNCETPLAVHSRSNKSLVLEAIGPMPRREAVTLGELRAEASRLQDTRSSRVLTETIDLLASGSEPLVAALAKTISGMIAAQRALR